MLAQYREADRGKYLDNVFRAQLVAAQYDDAERSIGELRALEHETGPQPETSYSQYLLYLSAKRIEAKGTPFAVAYRAAFDARVRPLDDVHALYVARRLVVLGDQDAPLQAALTRQGAAPVISLPNALSLLRVAQSAQMYRAFGATTAQLLSEDDERRYLISKDISIHAPDGRVVCAYLVRPRSASSPLTALLQYSIYADSRVVDQDARLSAAHGYAGVNAYTPGKACSEGSTVPYVGEGQHARAVIEWITRQPWSNGAVGMFGGSYAGFAVWAAAKTAPPALKAMMSSVSNAPGVDTPMEGNIFETWVWPWPPYVTRGQWLNAGVEGSPVDLEELQRKWYRGGASYRSLSALSSVANPVWQSWLEHPLYDAFWRGLVPDSTEYSRIRVPVLLTDGYLSGQGVGGLFYFDQLRTQAPQTPAYLLVGPYDHLSGQFGTTRTSGRDLTEIDGYRIDSVAQMDMLALRYQWFDHSLKGAPRPELLQDRVNLEVMHANRWRHAASVAEISPRSLKVHLRRWEQTVDLKDRSDAQRTVAPGQLDTWLGAAYESEPLPQGAELCGEVTGQLHLTTNKRDFDLSIAVYQKRADGSLEAITASMVRASSSGDRRSRRLLTAQASTTLPFRGGRLTAWGLEPGSRLVVVVSVLKAPGFELNYGTGGAVADESVVDAHEPLRIQWFDDSFVDLPVR
jgi:hypothetical protein